MRLLAPLLAGLLLSGATAFAQMAFPVVIARTDRTMSLVADLDNDGRDDLIGNYHWARNLGNGEFAPQVALLPQGGVTEPTIHDVNGDGLLDIVLAMSNGSIRLHLNQGGGVFSPDSIILASYFHPVYNASNEEPMLIDFVDITGDGNEDLVVTFNFGVGMWGYNNTGPLTYGSRHTLLGTLNYVDDVEFADVNYDGFMDIGYTVNNVGGDNLAVALNQGNGTFAAPVVAFDQQGELGFMEFTDLTGDGILDIVFTKGGSLQLSLMVGAGNGTFGADQVLASNVPAAISFTLRDVTGDGIEDAVMASLLSTSLFFLPGTGTGFGPMVSVSGLESDASYLMATDADGDGDTDLIVQGDFLRLFLNNGTGSAWESVLLTTRYHYNELKMGDMDQDGDADLLVMYNDPNGYIVWHEWQNGQFLPRRVALDSLQGPAMVEAADMDGDGNTDLVFATELDKRIWWARNLGGGVFSSAHLITQGNNISNFEIGDIDNDGDLDVVTTVQSLSTSPFVMRFILNDGIGNFTIQYPAGIPNSTYAHFLRDLNGDGRLDLLYRTSANLTWYRNNGNNSFTLMPTVPFITNGSKLDIWDVDGDGWLDAVMCAPDQVSWARNLGGSFASAQLALTVAAYFLHHADVDGDGSDDALVGTNNPGLFWHRNLGNGTFEATGDPILLGLNVDLGSGNVVWNQYSVVVHDVDANGTPDFLLRTADDWLYYRTVWISNLTGQVGLSGQCYLDMDADGSFSAADVPAPWLAVEVSPTPSVPYSAADGNYHYAAAPGTYTVNLGSNWPGSFWSVNEGAAGYQPTMVDQNITGLDFGLMPLMDTAVVELALVDAPSPCGSHTTLWLSVDNPGTLTLTGTAQLVMDSLFTYVSSNPVPVAVQGDTITWELTDLAPLATRTFSVVVQRPGVSHLGEAQLSTATATVSGGAQPASFTTALLDTVLCSFDPNDKQVEPIGFGASGAVDIATDRLTYTIRFQNTGLAPAQDVELRDALPALVRSDHLNLVAYSHEPTAFFVNSDGELVVRFVGIQLPDSGTSFTASQGFVRFVAELLPGQHLDEIANTAGIYFDNNPPVITNTTLNTLVDCSLWSPVAEQDWAGQITATEGIAYQWYLNGEALPGETAQIIELEQPGIYSVLVTSAYGCVAVSPDAPVIALGTADAVAATALVAPNPFSTTACVMLPASGPFFARLQDAAGRTARTLSGHGSLITLDRQGLPAGIYILSVDDGHNSILRLRVTVVD